MSEAANSKAEALRAMHNAPPILVLPNAWDAVSARLFVQAGARAVATTSAGIAFSMGYADGQNIPRDCMLQVISRIARAVQAPVTADIESGYAISAKELGETIRLVIAAGAVGGNLEDVTGDPAHPLFDLQQQLDRIRAVREAAARAKVSFVLNARTDVYLAKVGDPAGRFAESVRRLNAFREAGADCLFAPGVTDLQTITDLARNVSGPLNVLAGAGTPPVADLQRIGVARLSVGSALMRATLATARDAATELLQHGTYSSFLTRTIPFDELNALMKPAGK
ncbi:MAG TPA: isocitrate lyase/phosphoenolpyruvate mutase family protein [Candidatus Acidoferrum sp.]